MHRLAIAASVAVVAAMCTNCAREESSSSGNLLPSPSILAPSSVDSANGVTIGAEAKGGGGGKPGGGGTTTGGGSSSLTLVTNCSACNDQNKDGLPNWSDTITFNVSTTATSSPQVALACYQNGVNVAGSVGDFFDNSPWPWTRYFTLNSVTWTGGGANCTATLQYMTARGVNTLASISFNVNP